MNERYIRQTMIPEIGEAGQEKLKNAKVCLIYTSDAADEL